MSRFLRAIETSAEFGLTLAVGLDAEAVRSLADGWFGRAAVDPVFAAIERHKVAEAAFGATLKAIERLTRQALSVEVPPAGIPAPASTPKKTSSPQKASSPAKARNGRMQVTADARTRWGKRSEAQRRAAHARRK